MDNLETFLENYNAGHDLADSRDYTIDEVLEGWGASGDYSLDEFEEEVHNNIIPFLNQGNIGACSLFGSAGAYFETYAQAIKPQEYKQPFTLWDIWDEAKKRGASDTQGWWLQSMLQLLVDLKKTGNYVLLGMNIDDKAIYNMCKAIAEGRNFVTGFYHIDWSEVVRTGKYAKSPQANGHIVYFNRFKKGEYEDGSKVAFYSPNNWGGRGAFWMTENELKKSYIFKQYTWLLTDEHEKFVKAKKKRKNEYLQKAFEKKIWNEEGADEVASAYEIRVMLNRALRLVDDGISADWRTFRSSYACLFDEKIARGKVKIFERGKENFMIKPLLSSPYQGRDIDPSTGSGGQESRSFDYARFTRFAQDDKKGDVRFVQDDKVEIWNEQNAWHMATDMEIALMFTRAVLRDGSTQELKLTRERVAEVIGRDFL